MINVETIIKQTLEVNHIMCYPIEEFTIDVLNELTKKARYSKIKIVLSYETSNFYCGVLVKTQKMQNDCVEKL